MMSDEGGLRPAVTLEFDDWADAYVQLGAEGSPSELHGILTGSLAAGRRLSSVEWLKLVAEHVGPELFEPENEEMRRQFEAFYKEGERAVQQQSLSFSLMLPDDDLPLGQRLESIGSWCYGFIEGFSQGLAKARPELSEDTRELLTDIMAIAEIDPETEETDEQERYYAELVEFVRVAAMNLYDEFNPATPTPSSPSVH